jgi:hypothetical protein
LRILKSKAFKSLYFKTNLATDMTTLSLENSTASETSLNLNHTFKSDPMRLLPFSLHEFTRVSWVSDSARETWQPRFARIIDAWVQIEWLAILAGVRSCCITVASPDQFIERAPNWARHNLYALPMGTTGIGMRTDSKSGVVPDYGQPFAFRFVLGLPKHVSEFKDAWDRSDDVVLGDLLGHPKCCRDFFKQVWVDEGLFDTTWPMAVRSSSDDNAGRVVEINAPSRANILWRWLGIRCVPHLPCRFDCVASIELAEQYIQIARDYDFDDEMDWLLEILDWPVEWSALHGIAEIKSPVLKISTQTDATPCKYTVRYLGRLTPPEGARGLRFPFSRPTLPVLTGSRGFKSGLDNTIFHYDPTADWYATDNGFPSVAAMDRAYEPIIKAATAVLSDDARAVLHLGCGNGALLRKLMDAIPSVIPYGVDAEPLRITHACVLLPRFASNVVLEDMELRSIWGEGMRYALAILRPEQFLNVTSERAAYLMARLQSQCDRIMLYACDGWLVGYDKLKELALTAGFELVEQSIDSATARFIRLDNLGTGVNR